MCGTGRPADRPSRFPVCVLAPYEGVVMSSVMTGRTRRRALGAATAACVVASVVGVLAPAAAAAGRPPHRTALPAASRSTPDLKKAVAYLVAPTRLTDGHYYQPFGGGFADFGLTIDGGFALAATGGDDAALKKVVAFFDDQGVDGSQRTVNDWTSIGTQYASGGSIAKEALFAEVVGADPRAFGGHDLIAALDQTVCAKATDDNSCAAHGSYQYGPSVFSQALGVMAQSRAGDAANAAAPIAYLESLQHTDGAWPSLIPASGDSDVDSTAMAVMALALVPGDTASSAVAQGVAWIAAQQEDDGGFPGAAGDSTNSAGLAIQALSLDKSRYSGQIARALAFLAGEQNADGGFDVAAGGQSGSDVRASAQVVSGATGTSFGTLSDPVAGTGGGSPSPTPSTSGSPTPSASPTTDPSASATAGAGPTPSISTVTGGQTGAGAAGTAGGGTGELAATGTDAPAAALAAAALVSAGAATVLATRRRRRPAGKAAR